MPVLPDLSGSNPCVQETLPPRSNERPRSSSSSRSSESMPSQSWSSFSTAGDGGGGGSSRHRSSSSSRRRRRRSQRSSQRRSRSRSRSSSSSRGGRHRSNERGIKRHDSGGGSSSRKGSRRRDKASQRSKRRSKRAKATSGRKSIKGSKTSKRRRRKRRRPKGKNRGSGSRKRSSSGSRKRSKGRSRSRSRSRRSGESSRKARTLYTVNYSTTWGESSYTYYSSSSDPRSAARFTASPLTFGARSFTGRPSVANIVAGQPYPTNNFGSVQGRGGGRQRRRHARRGSRYIVSRPTYTFDDNPAVARRQPQALRGGRQLPFVGRGPVGHRQRGVGARSAGVGGAFEAPLLTYETYEGASDYPTAARMMMTDHTMFGGEPVPLTSAAGASGAAYRGELGSDYAPLHRATVSPDHYGGTHEAAIYAGNDDPYRAFVRGGGGGGAYSY